jgi:hypothetical protein
MAKGDSERSVTERGWWESLVNTGREYREPREVINTFGRRPNGLVESRMR